MLPAFRNALTKATTRLSLIRQYAEAFRKVYAHRDELRRPVLQRAPPPMDETEGQAAPEG